MTAWTHLTEKVTFVCGSALQAPFPDASFDVVWTQHASMSIADKPQFFAEVHRVLRPGGRFALFDVVAGPNAPVLWTPHRARMARRRVSRRRPAKSAHRSRRRGSASVHGRMASRLHSGSRSRPY